MNFQKAPIILLFSWPCNSLDLAFTGSTRWRSNEPIFRSNTQMETIYCMHSCLNVPILTHTNNKSLNLYMSPPIHKHTHRASSYAKLFIRFSTCIHYIILIPSRSQQATHYLVISWRLVDFINITININLKQD